MSIGFTVYGEKMGHVGIDDLSAMTDIICRIETSGSEGFYVEVARWSADAKQYRRYAFCKFLGGEILPDAGALDNAREALRLIGTYEYEPIIHSMPNCGEQ